MKQRDIIDNYRDLPIGKYEEICRLCETPMTEVDRKVGIVAILTGLTEDEVLHLPLETFTLYSAKACFLEEECPENLIPSVSKVYHIGDFTLVPTMDIRKVTTAQYVDFQTFSQDRDHRLVEILSCFLIPKGMEYNEGYDVLEVHRAIREEMSYAEVLALTAFFFRRWRESIQATLISSMREVRKIRSRETRDRVWKKILERMDSMTSGDGSQTSTE